RKPGARPSRALVLAYRRNNLLLGRAPIARSPMPTSYLTQMTINPITGKLAKARRFRQHARRSCSPESGFLAAAIRRAVDNMTTDNENQRSEIRADNR